MPADAGALLHTHTIKHFFFGFAHFFGQNFLVGLRKRLGLGNLRTVGRARKHGTGVR